MTDRPHSPPGGGALFLGPKAENAGLLERLIVEALRDHASWRRDFHPEDPSHLSEAERSSASFQETQSRLSRALRSLLRLLKGGVPLHSPRYLAHMASDTSMAAIAGYFAAMLYNPNNVSAEASPSTTQLELEVGRGLATMIGFEPSRQWSHLTSGGTLANFEALWIARTIKYLPVALRWASRLLSVPVLLELPDGTSGLATELELWRLLNVSPAATLDAAERLLRRAGAEGRAAIDASSLSGLGAQEFGRRLGAEFGDALRPALVLVPSTAHYSWEKLCRALGVGASQLVKLPVDRHFRMDLEALDEVLGRAVARQQPVLACIAVAGTTEEGAVDRVDAISLRRARASLMHGLTFHLHVDAAYGGYAVAVTRDARGRRRRHSELAAGPAGEVWPEEDVYRALCGLERADSVTIDPHKLGYVPYPAGAICFRDGRVKDLISAEAPYVFTGDEAVAMDLGRYVFEGSRPGAAAAAVWLSHRVLPLDETGYGGLIRGTALAAWRLHRTLATHDFGPWRAVLLPRGDLNLVCFTFAHPEERSLEALNARVQAVHAAMCARDDEAAAGREFFVSRTTLGAETYGPALLPLLSQLGFGLEDAQRAGGVTVLRSTLMNPALCAPEVQAEVFPRFARALRAALAATAPSAARPEEARSSRT